MLEITSLNNRYVKSTLKLSQKKYRSIENKFLIEGFKSIYEAFECGIDIEYVFVLREKADKYAFLGDKVIIATNTVLKKISTTDTAPEAVGVGRQRHFSVSDLKDAKKLVLLENIRDLGNLGTVLRSAAAFGADGVILYGEPADLYNPKCVRSAVGNLWKLPVVHLDKIKGKFADFQRVATLPHAKNSLKNFKPADKIIVMFGSEADGLSQELIDYATESVKIEMADNVESLNLSVACAIVLYELFIL